MAYQYGLAPIVRHRKRRMTKGIVREDGPFLLWSHYHEAWHCRSSTGNASGYTGDLSKAGVFGFHVAKQYHDLNSFPVRDEAIPLSRAQHHLLARQTELRSHLAECEYMIGLIPPPKPKGRPKKE